MLKMLKKYRWFFYIGFIPYLAIILSLSIFLNYEIDLPGGVRPINNVVRIDSLYDQSGTISSTFVITQRKCTLFQKVVCSFDDRLTIEKMTSSYNYYTAKEDNALNSLTKEISIQQSLIVAYEEAMKTDNTITLDKKFIGKFIMYRYSNAPIGDREFQIGDIILGGSEEEVLNIMKEYRSNYLNGNKGSIKILRGDKKNRTITEVSPSLILEGDTYTFGHLFGKEGYYSYYDITNVNPQYEIINSSVGGDSGGLLQALSIYNAITKYDYTNGLKIAGTGAILASGKVYAIGAMKQKIYTADISNIDIFFIPTSLDTNSAEYDNYLVAVETYNKLKNPKFKLVPVKSFSEAINYLKEMGEA